MSWTYIFFPLKYTELTLNPDLWFLEAHQIVHLIATELRMMCDSLMCILFAYFCWFLLPPFLSLCFVFCQMSYWNSICSEIAWIFRLSFSATQNISGMLVIPGFCFFLFLHWTFTLLNLLMFNMSVLQNVIQILDVFSSFIYNFVFIYLQLFESFRYAKSVKKSRLKACLIKKTGCIGTSDASSFL